MLKITSERELLFYYDSFSLIEPPLGSPTPEGRRAK